MKTIPQIAQTFRISELRVHALIRQGIIAKSLRKSRFGKPDIVVSLSEVERYFNENPKTLAAWQEKYDQ